MVNVLLVLLGKTEGLVAMSCLEELHPPCWGLTLWGRWELQDDPLEGLVGREGEKVQVML